MKKLIYLIFIAVIFSCGKDGDIGPQGIKATKEKKDLRELKGLMVVLYYMVW
ncbi:hypothetical protein KUH03_17010 [Sphingobacterium sp. E70]|uniref:hypothetical protein n=1 Tax=Sphingobacterium sp. E70 TaxID=2853439 RepID=UPI00211C0449|nr:hypothetical protein [Sphingobacterium sp. E70]ULT28140.1 hypothetical protein KUH03_17010 [Sphingobacterium sp. E70]